MKRLAVISPLVYKAPPGEGSLQNLYGAQTIYHSKSLCYKPPPERGHLSRTGQIGGLISQLIRYYISKLGDRAHTISCELKRGLDSRS